jgi:hypothetical protein
VIQAKTREFYRAFDPSASTDYFYGRYAEGFINVPNSAKTSGSSTTVVEGSTGNRFADAIGQYDELYVRSTGDRVLVTARASEASITISAAKDWSSIVNLQVRKFQGGQTSTDGWIKVAGWRNKVIHYEILTLGSTSVQFSIETRIAGMNSSRVLNPAAISAVTVQTTTGTSTVGDIPIPESCEEIRLGVIVVSDGTDVISAAIHGEVDVN